MSPLAISATNIFSFGTLVLDGFVLLGIVMIFWPGLFPKTLAWSARNAILLSFILSLAAMLASLFYSEIIGFAPCELCWWARIFLYPQVFLFGLALWRQKKGEMASDIIVNSLVLSIIGAGITLYHYYGQSFNPDVLPACTSTGVTCSKIYFTDFGYITLPMMAFSTFAALIVLMIIRKRRSS